MKQLTIRGVSEQLAAKLNGLAREGGRSVNATVLDILGQALDANARRERLERLAPWDAKDLKEFGDALSAQRTIDDELWR